MPRPWITACVIAAAPALASAQSSVLSQHSADKPNILLLIADDLGWNAVSYHHGFARTPHIDALVHRGVELDRFYAAPMCSPTRAGILTGCYPLHLGIGRSVIRPWLDRGLPDGQPTLPALLGQAGYTDRAAFGKWHLGHLSPQFHPLNKGFTHYEGCYNGAADYFTRERDGEIDWHVDFTDTDPKGYTTDIIADRACDFIKAHARPSSANGQRPTANASPFFAYVAFTAVHDPAQAPQSLIDRYPDLDGKKKLLAAQDTSLDDNVQRILTTLKDAGLEQNTLVWFLSDNGGVRNIPGNNAPLRSGKLTCYEGGIRTPAAVYWPGHVDGGRKFEHPVASVDLLPTLLHAAGSPPKGDPAHPTDGVDVLPLLDNDSSAPAPAPARDVFAFTGQEGLDHEQISIIAPDLMKLLVIGPDLRQGAVDEKTHKIELFDLAKDPGETTDLAKDHPDKVKELLTRLVAFRASEPKDAMPTANRKPADFKPPKHWHNGPAATADK